MSRTSKRPPLPRTFVDEHKRERCAMGLSAAVHKVGVHGLTVALVVRRAKMARNTFYELFRNQEEALQYARDLGSRLLREAIESASADGRREERLEAAIGALLSAAQRNPYLIELYLVHGTGRLADQRLVEALTAILTEDEGAPRSDADSISAELLAHSLLAPIAERLRKDEADSLAELSSQLTALAMAYRRRTSPSDIKPALA